MSKRFKKSTFVLLLLIAFIVLNLNNINRIRISHIFLKNNIVYKSDFKSKAIEIFQVKNYIVINVYSEYDLDEPNQYIAKVNSKIDDTDIKITWLGVMGDKSDKDSPDIGGVKVEIYDFEKIIISKNFSFMEKGFQGLGDYLKSIN